MNKIAILHASNTKNYGTMMMVTNFIHFTAKFKNLIYYVDNEETDGISRLKAESKKATILPLSELGILNNVIRGRTKNKILKGLYYFQNAIFFGKKFREKKIETVVILGGDDFSEYYPLFGLLIEYIKILSLNVYGLKVYLIGQTIGPFSSWRNPISKYVLSKTKIITRDKRNYEYLTNNLRLKGVNHSKDLAFLDLPNQYPKKRTKDNNTPITIVPSGIWKSYYGDRSVYINNWISLIENLSVDHDIILLAHVLTTHSSDALVIEDIYSSLSEGCKRKVTLKTHLMLPSEAREIINNSRLVITGRMHAAVSAFQVNVPAISISYSVKYKGVIGELGREDLIVEGNEESLWKNGELYNKIKSKVDYVISDYDRVVNEIDHSIYLTKKTIMTSIEDLMKEINYN